MKKYILLLVLIVTASVSFSQIQASLGAGSAQNRLKIYLKPLVTNLNALVSTLNFNIALPQSITPIPSLVWVNGSGAFATANSWTVSTPYIESGYINYNITPTAPSFSGVSFTANQEILALEVQFGQPTGCSGLGCGNGNYGNTALLLTIADGGTGGTGAGLALFYCTGSLNSNGSSLYYARTGVTVNNTTSYLPIAIGSPSSPLNTNSSATYTSSTGPLPIKFTDFTAVRRDNDGQLAWTVDNQDPNTLNFGIERSFNGTDFRSIGSIDANILLGSVGTYSFTDPNIVRLRSSGVIYYRLKEVDRDGHFVYSDIRSIKLDSKAITINLYPNPAQAYTNLMLDLPEATTVAVSITDVAGQTMQQFSFPGIKGNNQHKINLNKYAAGTYMIKVNAGDQMKTISVVKTE